jgi:hypothetical protein
MFNCTSLVLSQHIKSVGLPPRKISSFLRSVKGDLGLKTPGLYIISHEWSQVYIGQIGCSIYTRLKEHHQHICLEHPVRSALAEHGISLGHCVQLHNTTVPSTKPVYMHCIIREAVENELHANNMNREDGLCVSKTWKPVI